MSKRDIAKQVAIAKAAATPKRKSSRSARAKELTVILEDLVDVVEDKGGEFISARVLDDGRIEITYARIEKEIIDLGR